MLAVALTAVLRKRGHEALPVPRAALDVTDATAVAAAVNELQPDVAIQCAAYTRVDEAEADAEAAVRVNVNGTAHLASACRAIAARVVYPSTDYVFDGSATLPIPPDAETAPLNTYGRSKLAGEAMAATSGDALVVRTSWLYGHGGRHFVGTILDRAQRGEPLRVVDDQTGSPTWTHDLARMIVSLLEVGAPAGIYHATNSGSTTWYGLAAAALDIAGVRADLSMATSRDFAAVATRPSYSVLDCSRTYALVGEAPDWRDALARFIAEASS